MAGNSYTALTLTTTLTAGQKAAYYDDRFLERYREQLQLIPFAQKRPLPQHNGKVIDFFRYHNLTLVTSAQTEGSQSVTAEKIQGMNITATLQQYVKLVDWSELEALTHRDADFMASVTDLLGQNAAESLDWVLMKDVAKWGCYAIRADMNATYEKDYTCSITSYGATTNYGKLVCDDLTQTHNTANELSGFWAGAWVTAVKGKNYGECRRVSWFSLTADTCYFNGTVMATGTADASGHGAWPEIAGQQAAANYGDMHFHICTPYNGKGTYATVTDTIINAGGGNDSVYLNIDALLKATTILRKNGAKPFADGMFKCVCSYDQYLKIFNDDDWKNMNIHTMREGIIKGKVGEVANMDILLTTQAYRENASTHLPNTSPETAVTAGVDVVLCFGQDAFGAVDISGVGGPNDPKIGFKDTKSDTGDPTGQTSHAYWKAYFAYRPLNANHVVGILCKAVS